MYQDYVAKWTVGFRTREGLLSLEELDKEAMRAWESQALVLSG